jgi:hypothetical protein
VTIDDNLALAAWAFVGAPPSAYGRLGATPSAHGRLCAVRVAADLTVLAVGVPRLDPRSRPRPAIRRLRGLDWARPDRRRGGQS